MAVLDQEKVDKIKQYLRWHPRGMAISDLASKVGMNRNLVAKYLDVLHISGQVEMEVIGAARVYFLSRRVPISAMIEFSSDFVIVLDAGQRIIQVNEQVLTLLGRERDALVGKSRDEIRHPLFDGLPVPDPVEHGQIGIEKNTEIHFDLNGESLHFRAKLMPTVFENGAQGITYIVEDITAQKRYEESLQISEARYRGIIEDQTEFITRYRPDGTLTFVNESYARYLGKRPEELLGTAHIPGIDGVDRTMLDTRIAQLDPEHPVSTIECRITDPAGRPCWNLWTIRALFDEGGAVHEYQGVGMDITEKRVAASRINSYIQNMEFFSRKLQEFIELPPDADIYQAIGAGLEELFPSAFIAVNTFEEQPHVLTVKAVFGQTVRDCIARHFHDRFVGMKILVDERVPETLKTGKLFHIDLPFHEIVFRQVPEEACNRIVRDLRLGEFHSIGLIWQGRLYGNMAIGMPDGEKIVNAPFVEIYARAAAIALRRRLSEDALKESERERTEEALRNSENYLVNIFNSTQSGLVIIDPETHAIFDANSTAIDLIGAAKDELVGSPCKKWLCPAENALCPVLDLGRHVIRSEALLRTSSGEQRSIIRTVVPVPIGGREYLLESFVDITERKRADEALRESEEKYRLVVENSHDAIYIYGGDRFLFASTRTSELTGYSHDELMGMNIWDLIHPDDRAPLQASAKRRLLGEPVPPLFNARILTRAGELRLGEFFVERINYRGEPAILGICRDVTARVRAEEALRESESRFRDLAGMLPQAVWECDANGLITYANLRSLEMYRYRPEDLAAGVHLWQLIHTDDRDRGQGDFAEAMKQEPGASPASHEYLSLRKDGTTFPVLVYHAPVVRDGGIAGLRGIAIDISEQRASELLLRQSEELYRTLTETSPGMIYLIDPAGDILFANTAGAARFGVTPEEIAGKPLDAIFNHYLVGRYMDALNTVIATGEPLHTEMLETFPGSACWIDVHLAPVRDKDGKIISALGISHDITGRKRAEQQLRESESRLQAILHSSPIPKYVIDANHRVLFWNKALEEFSGIRAEEVIGTTRRWQILPESDRPCLADLMIDGGLESVQTWYGKKILPSQYIEGAVEVTDFFPQGGGGKAGGTWLHHTAVAIRDGEGKTLGAVETIEDITARHHLDKLKFNFF